MTAKKIIIEIDDDFCPKCFIQLNQHLNMLGLNMTRMRRVGDIEVYKWIEKI